MFADLFTKTSQQKKAVAAIASVVLIFRPLKRIKQKINNKILY
jgi:hypothetical protein